MIHIKELMRGEVINTDNYLLDGQYYAEPVDPKGEVKLSGDMNVRRLNGYETVEDAHKAIKLYGEVGRQYVLVLTKE